MHHTCGAEACAVKCLRVCACVCRVRLVVIHGCVGGEMVAHPAGLWTERSLQVIVCCIERCCGLCEGGIQARALCLCERFGDSLSHVPPPHHCQHPGPSLTPSGLNMLVIPPVQLCAVQWLLFAGAFSLPYGGLLCYSVPVEKPGARFAPRRWSPACPACASQSLRVKYPAVGRVGASIYSGVVACAVYGCLGCKGVECGL
jgi:hypothetical protein